MQALDTAETLVNTGFPGSVDNVDNVDSSVMEGGNPLSNHKGNMWIFIKDDVDETKKYPHSFWSI